MASATTSDLFPSFLFLCLPSAALSHCVARCSVNRTRLSSTGCAIFYHLPCSTVTPSPSPFKPPCSCSPLHLHSVLALFALASFLFRKNIRSLAYSIWVALVAAQDCPKNDVDARQQPRVNDQQSIISIRSNRLGPHRSLINRRRAVRSRTEAPRNSLRCG